MKEAPPPWAEPAARDAGGGGAYRGNGQTIGNDGTAKLWELRR